MTRADLLRDGTAALARAGIAHPARETRLALRWAAGLAGAALAAAVDAPVAEHEAVRFAEAIRRRAGREPLSHITGTREFWGRAFAVGPDVLDPRPDTETLIAEALQRGPFDRILDLGTGSGCLLITLLAEWPESMGLGTDISGAALAVARTNAERHGVAGRAAFVRSDWMNGITGHFGLIVSNPPYIAEAEIAALDPEVRDHEPRIALTPGGDGLDAYRAIAAGVRAVAEADAWLMVEIGPTQSDAVSAILAGAGHAVLRVIPDLDLRPRLVLARVGRISAF